MALARTRRIRWFQDSFVSEPRCSRGVDLEIYGSIRYHFIYFIWYSVHRGSLRRSYLGTGFGNTEAT